MSDIDSDNDSDISFEEDSDVDAGLDLNEDDVDIPTVLPWTCVDIEGYEKPFPLIEFAERTGARTRLPVNAKPIEYFNLLSTNPAQHENLIDLLVRETNLYAQQSIEAEILKPNSRAHSWHDTKREEMEAFLGLILSMGILKKPSIESYWQEGTQSWLTNTPAFSRVMRRNRFQLLLKYLHCNDNTLAVPHGQPGYDAGFKIRPVLDLLNHTFSLNYSLARDITVDESLVGFKGRNRLVQYMPAKKSHRWGPKLFLLAESDTGYIHHIKLYTGTQFNE